MSRTDVSSAWDDLDGMNLNAPADGVPLDADQFSYTTSKSSANQAAMWNLILAEHPTLSPSACGHRVGVAGTKTDGRFPLVWIAA